MTPRLHHATQNTATIMLGKGDTPNRSQQQQTQHQTTVS
jgi:hypothetical protein